VVNGQGKALAFEVIRRFLTGNLGQPDYVMALGVAASLFDALLCMINSPYAERSFATERTEKSREKTQRTL
jgi:hypothetical protein